MSGGGAAPQVAGIGDCLIYKRLASEFGRIAREFRHRKALSIEKISRKSGVLISRIERFEAGLEAPCFSEMLTLANAYKVRASAIAGPLQQLYDDHLKSNPSMPGLFQQRTSVVESDVRIAERAILIQRLGQTDKSVIDITIADWPAILPPGFMESMDAERAVLRVALIMLAACRASSTVPGHSIPRVLPPGKVLAERGKVLSTVHFVLTGVRERLGGLITRHLYQRGQAPSAAPSSPRNSQMRNDDQSGADARTDTAETALPFGQRVEAQRTQIAKAMSIIEACRLGGDSMLAPSIHGRDDNDDDHAGKHGERETAHFEGALAAVNDILGDVLAGLEAISHAQPCTGSAAS